MPFTFVLKRGEVQNLSRVYQFHSLANKTHFHINGFARGLAFKQRLKATRKWPIE